MRVLAVIAFLALASVAYGSWAGQGRIAPGGALAGGDALILPMGDILNVRNIQGGVETGHRQDLNLDIAAGNSTHRGDVVVNFDVGERLVIYDGRKHRLAAFSRRGIVFYRRPIVRRR